MSKKVNTFLFLIAATVFNVLVFFIIFIPGYVALTNLFPQAMGSTSFGPVAFLGTLIASFVLAAVVYRLVLGLIRKKVDLDKHFDPIFGKSKDRLR
jgi:hypothetical protein